MPRCQNGYPALGRDECYQWLIPDANRHFLASRGPAGFLLAYMASWFHDRIERLDLGPWDDWGWAWREIRGSNEFSNHAGYAVDLNATRHPLGVPTADTFTTRQIARIHRQLWRMLKVIRWGGDYTGRPDAMHFEIIAGPRRVARAARLLRWTPRGRKLLKLNEGWR